MSDEGSLQEKRVFADTGETTTLIAATGVGVARISVSGDIVGEFALERRGLATDVAAADGRLAVATPDDVLVGVEGEFAETGFGPAEAVAFDRGLVAAGHGRIARREQGSGNWRTVGELEAVRSIEGDLVAADSGVHRLDGTHVGLRRAADVTANGRPLAATESGLYYLANGWMTALEGSFRAVANRPDGPAHAAGDRLYARDDGDEQWTPVELPVDDPVADVAYGAGRDGDVGVTTYAVTATGTVLVDAGDGWRSRSLGLPEVRRLAVLYG